MQESQTVETQCPVSNSWKKLGHENKTVIFCCHIFGNNGSYTINNGALYEGGCVGLVEVA